MVLELAPAQSRVVKQLELQPFAKLTVPPGAHLAFKPKDTASTQAVPCSPLTDVEVCVCVWLRRDKRKGLVDATLLNRTLKHSPARRLVLSQFGIPG